MKDRVQGHNVDDLRLPYLEGLLSPEERSNFEDHIHQCPACKSKLEEMNRWTSIFRENAREMCPDSWELFDYLHSGKDLRGTISSHVDACPLCRADAESFKTHTYEQAVPADLWKKIRKLSGTPPVDRSAETSYQWVLDKLDRLMDLFRPGVLVPVAVAVSILIVVFLYPTAPAPRMVALSSVDWGPVSSALNLMGQDSHTTSPMAAKKERLGTVIFFSNVKRLPGQNLTDSLYRALEPPKAIRDQYDVVSPEQLKRAAGEDLLKAPNEKALVEVMRSKLKISKAFVVEIVPSGDRYGIIARFVDTATGNSTEKWDSWNLTEAELPSSLERASETLLRR